MRLSRQQAKELGITWPADLKREKAPGGMNGTERRFSELCRQWSMMPQWRGLEWQFEAIKFRMADRTWLTPDFLVSIPNPSNFAPFTHVFVEVKARDKNQRVLWRDDAAVKLKTTAEIQPWPFWLASYGPGGWRYKRMPSRRLEMSGGAILVPWVDSLDVK